jgi:hypothetical protein
MYGLQRSGFDWFTFARETLVKVGWVELEGVEFVFRRGNCLMALYVDDIIISGPKKECVSELALIGKHMDIKDVGPLTQFLGITAFTDIMRENRRSVVLEQTGYAKLLSERFKEELKAHGESATLRKVMTPSCDDLKPEELDKLLKTRKVLFNESCRRHIGGLLYLCRCTRPDLSFAVGRIARRVTIWDQEADWHLTRIFQYLEHHTNYVLEFYGDAKDFLSFWIESMSDADHAGDMDSARSTSGWVTWLRGLLSSILLDWGSKRQGSVSKSTAEAETVALTDTITRSTFELTHTAELIFDRVINMKFLSDSEAGVKAVKKGYSRRLGYMPKHQRVSLAFCHDAMRIPGTTFEHYPGVKNTSDIMTKSIDVDSFHRHRTGMGVVQWDPPTKKAARALMPKGQSANFRKICARRSVVKGLHAMVHENKN